MNPQQEIHQYLFIWTISHIHQHRHHTVVYWMIVWFWFNGVSYLHPRCQWKQPCAREVVRRIILKQLPVTGWLVTSARNHRTAPQSWNELPGSMSNVLRPCGPGYSGHSKGHHLMMFFTTTWCGIGFWKVFAPSTVLNQNGSPMFTNISTSCSPWRLCLQELRGEVLWASLYHDLLVLLLPAGRGASWSLNGLAQDWRWSQCSIVFQDVCLSWSPSRQNVVVTSVTSIPVARYPQCVPPVRRCLSCASFDQTWDPEGKITSYRAHCPGRSWRVAFCGSNCHFCAQLGMNAILAAVLQYCPLMSNSPRYWVRYDPHAADPYDKGLILRERGRWRSQESLEYLIDLCLQLPPKRDHGDVAVRPAKISRVQEANEASLTTVATDSSGSTFSFREHPPPFTRCGPRELPEMRARALRDRLFTGISPSAGELTWIKTPKRCVAAWRCCRKTPKTPQIIEFLTWDPMAKHLNPVSCQWRWRFLNSLRAVLTHAENWEAW